MGALAGRAGAGYLVGAAKSCPIVPNSLCAKSVCEPIAALAIMSAGTAKGPHAERPVLGTGSPAIRLARRSERSHRTFRLPLSKQSARPVPEPCQDWTDRRR